MKVEIAFSETEGSACLYECEVPDGATIQQALMASALYQTHPDILEMPVGIFSQKATLETRLKEGDRISLFRPLQISPMDKRRLLAKTREKK